MTLSDKIVLIAGGTGGLGRAASLAFLDAGSQVIATYVHEKEFAELKTWPAPTPPTSEAASST